MKKIGLFIIMTIMLMGSSFAQSTNLVGGPSKFDEGIVITNIHQATFFEQIFSLFSVSGLKSSYNPGEKVAVTLSQMKMTTKDCTQGNARIILEIYSVPVGQHTTGNYIGSSEKLLNGGNAIYIGQTYYADLSYTLPGSASGTWSMSGYILCPQYNPANANTYSTVDEKNFNIVQAPPPAVCGNGQIESNEACDGGSRQCTSNGYVGNQNCNAQCTGWDTCQTTQRCGDGSLNGNEVCDGGNRACTANGYAGTENCNTQCSGYSACSSTFSCGDGIKQSNEVCDIVGSTATTSCPSGQSGSQTCNACTSYNTASCTTQTTTTTTQCTPDWQCTPYDTCHPAGYQGRICHDANVCGTSEGKPEEVRNCEYTIPSCDASHYEREVINRFCTGNTVRQTSWVCQGSTWVTAESDYNLCSSSERCTSASCVPLSVQQTASQAQTSSDNSNLLIVAGVIIVGYLIYRKNTKGLLFRRRR